MDNRPIGFFDSGLGGLTLIPYMLREFPHERIIYFGDTARTPYGSKAPTTIRRFASEISDFLIEAHDVKLLVIACNTASATALDDLRKRHPEVPILSIISPAAKTVSASCDATNRIGVIGTKATVESGAYTKEILAANPDLKVFGRACPAFVPLIEEGIIQDEIMDHVTKHYLKEFLNYNKIDTLVLGCTHYPLIRESIEKLHPGLRIVDPSAEMLPAIADALGRNGLEAGGGQAGESAGHVFHASDLSENFVKMIDLIFAGTDYQVSFNDFDLDGYLERKGVHGGS